MGVVFVALQLRRLSYNGSETTGVNFVGDQRKARLLSSSQNSNTSPTLLHVATTPALTHPNDFDASTPDLIDYVKCPHKLPITLSCMSSIGFLSPSSSN
ncbi:hypothetical protein PanWU01x14_308430 [Parasponia andersonii]|uniref:Uncharacterized protein n=1 Tax=Parasponia andersonii TaxID=3476 RepID=A0A2P5AQZ9_PARAD|nr:hypothetical protein PanWU01x14_308430 [Parasponia andersonii]